MAFGLGLSLDKHCNILPSVQDNYIIIELVFLFMVQRFSLKVDSNEK
jgi:hypothetical protein